jgi:carboxyl-terminal processing protease
MMVSVKRILIAVYATLLYVITTSTLYCGDSQQQFHIMQAFDVYGNAIKQILNNSLYDVEVDSLLCKSMEGMMSYLDPYAEYFTAEEDNEMSIVATGKYFGYGFGFRNINSQMVITVIRSNSPAANAGIVIGDIIYSVDSTIITDVEQLDRLLLASSDETLFRIIRRGVSDTLSFIASKDTINIQSVTIYKLLSGNIGYIKLEQFTANSYFEFRDAFYALSKHGVMDGLVVDLRGNGGGILQEATKIVNMFIPINSPIVATKGKGKDEIRVYRAIFQPVDTTLSLVVLIDEESASASELMAGCLQDLDRATIAGNTSFGKGLVQEVFDLNYNRLMKMTTARYYTPSGRCIQKIDYNENKEWRQKQKIGKNVYSPLSTPSPNKNEIDTASIGSEHIFYTHSGRKVYEQNGIIPDVFIAGDSITSKLAMELIASYTIFDFANYYCNTNLIDSNGFDADEVYTNFVSYVCDSDRAYLSAIQLLDSLISISTTSNEQAILSNTKAALTKEYREYLFTDAITKQEITRQLVLAIKYRLLSASQFYNYILQEDIVVRKATELLK